jgi:pimeloyl-ACP methyl ester carboxylesterase
VPSIVLLDDGRDYGGFAEALARATGCGVLSWSLPGPDAVGRLLETSGFEQGILVGHGDGATLATTYAGSVEDHRIWGLVLLAPRFLVRPAAGADALDLREELGYIRVPILIVQGDDAQVEIAREETYCPVDVVRVPGAGTSPQLDRPVETASAVAVFVAKLLETHARPARRRRTGPRRPA